MHNANGRHLEKEEALLGKNQGPFVEGGHSFILKAPVALAWTG